MLKVGAVRANCMSSSKIKSEIKVIKANADDMLVVSLIAMESFSAAKPNSFTNGCYYVINF